jgi:Predicted membrane protein (DUF2232)
MPNGPLLGFFATMPLMMVGLGWGLGAALMAAATGAVAVGLVQDWPFAVSFLIMTGLPAAIVTNRALLGRSSADGKTEWYPPGFVLAWLTVAAMVLFTVAALSLPEHQDGLKAWMAQSVAQAVDAMGASVGPEERRMTVDTVSAILPAIVMGVWVLTAVFNAVMAQAVLALTHHNRRPTPTYVGMDLPNWLLPVLVGSAAAAVALNGSPGYIAANMAAVALFPFALLGVATAHRLIAARPGARLGLTAMYGFLVLAFVWAMIPAAGLGLVRFLQTRFRRRSVSDGGKEE